MVDSVTASAPYSYLNQLLGVQNPQPASTSSSTTPPSTPAASSASNAASEVSGLLANNSFGPEILSLLQGGNAGNFDPVDSLLGGATSSDSGLTTLLTNLYTTSASAALTQAQNNATPAAPSSSSTAPTGANLIDSLLSSLTQASVAYNATLQQNVQNTVNSIAPITT